MHLGLGEKKVLSSLKSLPDTHKSQSGQQLGRTGCAAHSSQHHSQGSASAPVPCPPLNVEVTEVLHLLLLPSHPSPPMALPRTEITCTGQAAAGAGGQRGLKSAFCQGLHGHPPP